MRAYIMCGPIGSGKTYVAESLYGHIPRFNPDEIMDSDIWNRKNTNAAWDRIHEKIKNYSEIGLEFVVDSAQALPISRRRLTQYIREVAPSYKIICIFVKTPFDDCVRRNAKRERRVSRARLLEYYNNIMEKPPTRSDGYDKIVVVDNKSYGGNNRPVWKTKERWPKDWYHV